MKDVFIFALRLSDELTPEQGEILCRAADEKKNTLYKTAKARQAAQLSLTAQVLLRYAAAKVMHRPMSQVQITYTENGQPLLSEGWYCSVSHTGDLCVCALANQPIGVDAEQIRPCPRKIAEKYFSQDEKAFLQNAQNTDIAFFEIWTKHESFVKLTGEGLRAVATPIPNHVHTKTFLFEEKYVVSLSVFTNLT